jgi:hypothetical protein
MDNDQYFEMKNISLPSTSHDPNVHIIHYSLSITKNFQLQIHSLFK